MDDDKEQIAPEPYSNNKPIDFTNTSKPTTPNISDNDYPSRIDTPYNEYEPSMKCQSG